MLLVSIISYYSSYSYINYTAVWILQHWGVSSKLCNINLIFTGCPLSFNSINLILLVSLLYVELIVSTASGISRLQKLVVPIILCGQIFRDVCQSCASIKRLWLSQTSP